MDEREVFEVKCIKEVSDPAFTFFIEGEVYEVYDSEGEWRAADETQNYHIIKEVNETDKKWFDEHFIIE